MVCNKILYSNDDDNNTNNNKNNNININTVNCKNFNDNYNLLVCKIFFLFNSKYNLKTNIYVQMCFSKIFIRLCSLYYE